MKTKRYIAAISVVAVGICWVYFNYGLPWNYWEAKDEFQEHLSQYHKKMILEDVYFYFMDQTYNGWAHVAENPEIRFFIGEDDQTGEIHDGYLFEKVNFEAQKDVISILNEYLPEHINVSVELISLGNKELEINIKVHKKVSNEFKQKIKEAIENKGYSAEQLFFYVKN